MEAERLETETHSQAEQGRARVQWYFSERGGTPGSVFEIFSGKGQGQGDMIKLPTRKRETASKANPAPAYNCGGYSATRVYASESRQQKSSKIPISTGRSGAPVRRAIAGLPSLHQSWVQYCYSTSYQSKRQAGAIFTRLAWEKYRADYLQGSTRKRTESNVRHMFHFQVTKTFSFSELCLWSSKMPEQLAVIELVNKETWKKTYRRHWIDIHDHLVVIDRKAMERVAEALGGAGLA